jgi:hypothetical protein
MNNFDWSIEEHGRSTIVTADKPAGESRKGRFQKVVLVISLLTLIVVFAYWQLDLRLDAQTAVYEADVRAAFRVWQQAINQSDEELFNSLLVGTNSAWAASQRRYFKSGFFLDRSQLDLVLADEEGYMDVENIEIDLSPDLSSAEISFQRVYNILDDPENTLKIMGQIQLIYDLTLKRNEDRWYLAVPPEDYWGEWKIKEKSLLTLTYPERDEEWALQLAQDLEADLLAACDGSTAKICSEEETFELRLENKNAYNLYQKGWRPSLINHHTIVIPTFSLIGRPSDDLGYNQYYSFYARFIMDFFTTWIENPIPIKDREILLNCFPPDARSLKLISRVSGDGWVIDIPKESYRYLEQPENEEGDDMELEVNLQDVILDYPYLRFPDGSDPLILSSDGRWISTNINSPDLVDTWLIYTYDTQLVENHRYAVRYPSFTSTAPYYGWSEDGIWLLVVDQNYLRLIAPAYNYERLISHDLQKCSSSGDIK